jgi:plastocyanin
MLKKSSRSKMERRLYSLVILVLLTACVNVEQQVATLATTASHHQVTISGFEFVPDEIEVRVGDTITWVNRDVVPHNIIDIGNKKSVTPDLAQGEKFSYVVSHAMSYKCGFHPSMKGEVVIP